MQTFEFIRVGVDSPEQNRLARVHAARKRGKRREGGHELEQRQRQGIFRVRQRTCAPRLSPPGPMVAIRGSLPPNEGEETLGDEMTFASPRRSISPVYGALSVAAWPFDPYSLDARHTHYHFTIYAPQVMGEAQRQIRWAIYCKHTIVYHAFQYVSVVHQGILRGQVTQADRSGMLFHKAETIKLLRQMISDLDQQNLEAVLLAMYALVYGVKENDRLSSPKHILPFVPHMPLACWIGVYGRAALELSHFSAINAILQKTGGIDRLSSHVGLSLRVASLIAASASATRPQLPLSGRLDENAVQSFRLRTLPPDAPFGQGFALHLPASAYHVLSRTCLVDHMMLSLQHVQCSQPEYHSIVGPILLARNQAQHRLLSLPTWSELPQYDREVTSEAMYECCRQTAVLYSTAIIFPIPGDTGWYVPHVCRIRTLFEHSDLLDATGHAARPVIWSLFVCGIASYRTCHRRYFEDALRSMLPKFDLRTWTAVDAILKMFLWTDPACEHGAAVLWDALGLEDTLFIT